MLINIAVNRVTVFANNNFKEKSFAINISSVKIILDS